MALLISCWSRLAQQVRTQTHDWYSVHTTHIAAEPPRQHNRRDFCPDCLARQKAAAETRPLTSPGATERHPAGKQTARRTAEGCLAEDSSAAAFHGSNVRLPTTLVPLSIKCTAVLPVLDTATDTITLSLKCLRPLMRSSLGMAARLLSHCSVHSIILSVY